MRARVARDDAAEWIGGRLGEREGQARRRRHAERVAEPAGVLGGREAALARDEDLDDAASAEELRDPRVGPRAGGLGELALAAGALGDLVAREVAEHEQEVVQLVLVLEWHAAVAPRQRDLDLGDGLGVEELAQLGLPEQLAQAARVDGERLRLALGERQVAVVHEVGQRGGFSTQVYTTSNLTVFIHKDILRWLPQR